MQACYICGQEIKGDKQYPGAKVAHMACAVKACSDIREKTLKGVPEHKRAKEPASE